ncbi:MAG: CARDB domain-containing protein [Cyclobacteriaceae bacterium]
MPSLLFAQREQRLEYFFDVDQGYGQGTFIPSSHDDSEVTFNLPLENLDFGVHTLYLRVQDTSGVWSSTYNKRVWIDRIQLQGSINSVEYFIDSDPGFGLGKVIDLANDTTATFMVDLSGMGAGLHKLYLRTLADNGIWSTTYSRSFLIDQLLIRGAQNVVKAEYFLNTDPGFGRANPIALPVDLDGEVMFNVSLEDATPGFNNVYIRAMTADGVWSTTQQLTVMVEQGGQIASEVDLVEYFIDADPGYGNGISVPFSASSFLDLSFKAELHDHEPGFHQLFIRARDKNNNWSSVSNRQFYIAPLLPLAQDIISLEYFVDDDPGYGQGTQVPLLSGNDGEVSFVADLTALDSGSHTLYIRAKDALGRWSNVSLSTFDFGKRLELTGFSPTAGVPGSSLTINGFNFSPIPEVNLVKFNNVTVPVSNASATSLEVEVPSGYFGPVNITVTVNEISVTAPEKFQIVPNQPIITSIEPPTAVVGEIVTINGDHFGLNPANIRVTLGNKQAEIVGTDGQSLQFKVPDGIGGVLELNVAVSNVSAEQTFSFTVAAPASNRPPQITTSPVLISCLGVDVLVLADIFDQTNRVQQAILFYREIGSEIWSETRLQRTTGNTYRAMIPAEYITETGTEYYIEALDDYQVSSSTEVTSIIKVDEPLLSRPATNLTPENGMVNLDIPLRFTWMGSPEAVSYDFYFWPSNEAKPANPTATNLSEMVYIFNNRNIQFGQPYSWQVISKDACTSLPSEIQEITFRNLPDLVVKSVTLPSSALSEDVIEVQWEIENIGEGGTGNSTWFDGLYLSQEPVFDLTSAVFVKGIVRVKALDSGEAYSHSTTIKLPRGIAGEFYVFVFSDRGNRLLEQDNNNNQGFNVTPLQVTMRPTPDLAIGPIVVSPRNTFSEQKIALQWKVENVGTAKTESGFWMDEIYLSHEKEFIPNQAQMLKGLIVRETLEPGESYTKTDSITLPRGIDGKYFIHIHTNSREHVFEPQFNNISRSDSLDVRLLPPPDLIVSKIEVRETASNNESISVYWEVENQGPGAIEESTWSDRLYLSQSPDGITDLISLGDFPYRGNLEPGAKYQQQGSIVIPSSIKGPHYLVVQTDATNQVYEYIYEDNNTGVSTDPLQVLVPDLAITGINAPTNGLSGQLLSVSWTVGNVGEGAVVNRRWQEAIYLSRTRELTFDAIPLGSLDVQNSMISGASIIRSYESKLPDGLEGTFYVIVVIDPSNQVFEDGRESNNTLSIAQPIEIERSPWVDLVVTGVEVPGFSLAGMPIEVNYAVQNQGDKNAEGTVWTDRLYISLDSVWNPNEAHFLTEINRSQGLAVDGEYSVQTQVAIPLLSRFGRDIHDANGYVYVFTDAQNVVYEYTEKENNTGKSEAIFLTNPPPVNLRMDKVGANKHSLKSGESLTVNWSVSNTGNTTSIWNSGPWFDGVFLSTDSIWDATDIYVAQQMINEPVAEGANYQNSLNFRLPHGVFGEFYLLVVADYRNMNDDAHLTDNVKHLQVLNEQGEPVSQLPLTIDLSPSPDLVAEKLDVPILAVSGQPVSVHWEVSNQGDTVTTANSWSDRLYLSTNFLIDGVDPMIGSQVQERILGVGEIYQDSLQLMIPPDAEGNYVILLRSDDTHTMYEHKGKANNVAFRQILVSKADPSDLIIQTIDSPDTLVAGDPVTVSYQLQNIGENMANGLTSEAVYFSLDSLLDVTDIRLGVVDGNIQLGPMAETTRTLTSFANNLSPGSYHVLVQADIKNNINETNKENNLSQRLGRIEVVVPQLILGVERVDSLANGLRKYYRIHVPDSLEKETLLVELRGSEEAVNTMYLKYGDVPGPVNYDLKFGNPLSGNQEIVVEEMVPGDYYVLVTGQDKLASSQTIGIKASIVPFELRTVDASIGGNSGMVTVKLEGGKFTSDMVVSLERSNGEPIKAARMEWKNSILAFATFDLNGVPVGLYDVKLTKPDGNTAVMQNGFEVVPGIIKGLTVRAGLDNGSGGQSVTKAFVCCDRELDFDGVTAIGDYLPANTRPNRLVSMTFYIENNSNVDIPVLNRYLISMDGAPLGYTVAELEENKQEVFLEFKEPDGPEHILRPGSRSEITVYSRAVLPLRFQMIE